MDRYGYEDEVWEIQKATTFGELADIAIRVLKRMVQPVSMVCGPISTGGTGSVEKNLERFHRAIRFLRYQGITVFSQLPFENKIFEMKTWPAYKGDSCLLKELYLPMFESGLINSFYFLPDWETSNGASWEHVQAKRLGIRIIYYEDIVVF